MRVDETTSIFKYMSLLHTRTQAAEWGRGEAPKGAAFELVTQASGGLWGPPSNPFQFIPVIS